MTKDPRMYLAHILERIERVEQFTADGRERFLRDAMVQDAVSSIKPAAVATRLVSV
jgi:uncharacterized protein with HEPN domain